MFTHYKDNECGWKNPYLIPIIFKYLLDDSYHKRKLIGL